MSATTTLLGHNGHVRLRAVDLDFARETEWPATELAIEVELVFEFERVTLSPVAVTRTDWHAFGQSLRSVAAAREVPVDDAGNSSSDIRDCEDPALDWDGWHITGPFALRRISAGTEQPTAQLSIRQPFSCANPGHWIRSTIRAAQRECSSNAFRLLAIRPTDTGVRNASSLGFDVRVPTQDQVLGYGRHVDSDVPIGGGAVHLMLGRRATGPQEPQLCWSLAALIPSITGIHACDEHLILGARTSMAEAPGFVAHLAQLLRDLHTDPVGYIGLTDTTACQALAETTGAAQLNEPVAVVEILRLRHAGFDVRRAQAAARGCPYPDSPHIHSDNLAEDLTFEWGEQCIRPWPDAAPCAAPAVISIER